MNKIVVDKEMLLTNFEGEIEFQSDINKLSIEGKCLINEISFNKHCDLNINLKKGSQLEYNRLGYNPSQNGKIVINHEENSKIKFNYSIICKNDFELNVDVLEDSNNLDNEFNLRVINETNATILVNATGKVKKDTHGNIILEDLRGLNLQNGTIKMLPNLIVDSNDVIANHNVTISNVFEEDLFYLKAKGLNDDSARNLLKTGFILSIFNDKEFKEKIKRIL